MTAGSRLALALALAACAGDPENTLDGSVGVDLDFDRVSLRLIASDLEIRYLRSVEGGDEEVTAKLVVDVSGVTLAADLEMALTPDNAVVDRVVKDGSTFPALEMGTLVVNDGGDVGEALDGRFGVAFVTGATLSGDFRGVLETVDTGG